MGDCPILVDQFVYCSIKLEARLNLEFYLSTINFLDMGFDGFINSTADLFLDDSTYLFAAQWPSVPIDGSKPLVERSDCGFAPLTTLP